MLKKYVKVWLHKMFLSYFSVWYPYCSIHATSYMCPFQSMAKGTGSQSLKMTTRGYLYKKFHLM